MRILKSFVLEICGLCLLFGVIWAEEKADPSLVSLWSFDEGKGEVVRDSSGNNNDGEIFGATWADGMKGKALSFDGKDDYVEVPVSPSLVLDKNWTVGAWVKSEDFGAKLRYIVGELGEEGLSNPFALCIANEGICLQSFSGEAGRWQYCYGAAGKYNDNKWHQVTGTYDGNYLKVYLDGSLQTEKPVTTSPVGPGKSLIIGSRPGRPASGHENLKGFIDEVKVYNRALSPREIKSSYNNVVGTSEIDLLGLFEKKYHGIDKVFLQEDFNKEDVGSWTVVDRGGQSNWYVEDGVYAQTSPVDSKPCRETYSFIGSDSRTDYIFGCSVKCSYVNPVGVIFRYEDEDNYYRFSWSNSRNPEQVLEEVVNGKVTVLDSCRGRYTLGKWNDIKVVVLGEKMGIYINDVLSLKAEDTVHPSGKIGLYCSGVGYTYFDNVAVFVGKEPQFKDYTPELRIKVRPYLQNVKKDAITIMWETNVESTSEVRYGRGAKYGKTIVSDELEKIHEINIPGLKEETLYHYQVVSKKPSSGEEVFSKDSTFKTAIREKTPFTFAVCGDSRSQPHVYRKITDNIIQKNPGIFFNTGDVVYEGPVYEHWELEFFKPSEELLKCVPVYVSIGNHEKDANWFYRYVSYPAPENYYSFDYGNTHFTIIDSNEFHYSIEKDDALMMKPQYRWLEEDLKSTDAAWKIVFFHHPPYSSARIVISPEGEERAAKRLRRLFSPVFEKYGVDIVFNGHSHNYERSYPLRDGKTTKDGIVYITTGGGGAHLSEFTGEPPSWTVYRNNIFHYCIVKIKGKEFRMEVYDLDDRLIDSLTLKK